MQAMVVPPAALPGVRALLSGSGWELVAAPSGDAADAEPALRLPRPGQSLVFVPSGVTLPTSLRRVAVLHDGTPACSPAMGAADQLAGSHQAHLVVVHATDVAVAGEPGTLTALRLADHGPYDWQEWRDEFLRRFCPVAPGVSVTLELTSGPPVPATLDIVSRERADLVIATWEGGLDLSPGHRLPPLMAGSPCPFLVVREADTAAAGSTSG